LYYIVSGWLGEKDRKKMRLSQEWAKLYSREVKWKMSFSTEISIDQIQRGTRFAHASDYERRLRGFLPEKLKGISFRVDLATQDPRPINPMAETEKRVNIFNPTTGTTSPEPLKDIYRFIPARVVHLRVFALSHDNDAEISKAAEKMLSALEGTDNTNI
jgi:hypothetical protein